MKFKLNNIGIIKETEIELKNFTVLFGKNNTGKTYATYSVFGFLDRLTKILVSFNYSSINLEMLEKAHSQKDIYTFNIKDLINEMVVLIKEECFKYTKELHLVFSANPDVFENSSFEYINDIDIEGIINKEFQSNMIEKQANSEFVNIIFKDNKISELFDKFLGLKSIQGLSKESKDKKNTRINPFYLELINSFTLGNIIPIFGNNLFSNNVFILSAERTGIHLFQNELDRNRSSLIGNILKSTIKDKLSQKQDELYKLLENNLSRFALPLERNINFIRDIENIEKENSFLKSKSPELIDYIENMLNINYQIIEGRLLIIDRKSNIAIPSYLASTSVRSLFGLHLWLKFKAHPGDLLIIDEPELNLHPENQIKLARLLVKLVNSGIKVWITTHSDYIIKELNNMLMLSNNIENKVDILKELGYSEQDVLKKEDVNFYLATDNNNFSLIDVDEYGVVKSSFDDVIIEINQKSNAIITLIDKLLAK